QQMFVRLFSNLPDAARKESQKESPNLAAMFVDVAPHMDPETVRDAGLRFLGWLAKMPESGERNLALNMSVDALRGALGPEAFDKALEKDPLAQSAARAAGKPAEVEHEEEESASVLQAMGETGTDRTKQISNLPDSQRAREAAAHGFAV